MLDGTSERMAWRWASHLLVLALALLRGFASAKPAR
jgi:hypothetical protein